MEFLKSKHVAYFKRTLKSFLPSRFASLDSNRMTLCYFSLSGLDILNEFTVLNNPDRRYIIEWIYSLQIKPNLSGTNLHLCGFKGSTLSGSNETIHDCSHIAMTYTALLSLLILGDDLSGIDRIAISSALKHLQMKDGSFCATYNGSENDMRFVYCAASICYILDDWSNIDVQAAASYILNSLTYEGAFAQGPGSEAHGGSTFCAIASLKLMNCLELLSPAQIYRLRHWCISRQGDGFNGRPGKPTDTCYSFWVGASLKILNAFHLSDYLSNETFLLNAQDNVIGGIAKWIDHTPDTLHTYFGICGLSLIDNRLSDSEHLFSEDISTAVHTTAEGINFVSNKSSNHHPCSNHSFSNSDALTNSNSCSCNNVEHLNNCVDHCIQFDYLSIHEKIGKEVVPSGKYSLNPIHPALNVSIKAFLHLKRLHLVWNNAK